MLIATLTTLLDHHPGRFHDWNDDGGGWWFWGPLMMAVWIGLIVWVVLLVARRVAPHHDHHPHDRAREILAERYAGGELTTDEYNERLRGLGG